MNTKLDQIFWASPTFIRRYWCISTITIRKIKSEFKLHIILFRVLFLLFNAFQLLLYPTYNSSSKKSLNYFYIDHLVLYHKRVWSKTHFQKSKYYLEHEAIFVQINGRPYIFPVTSRYQNFFKQQNFTLKIKIFF